MLLGMDASRDPDRSEVLRRHLRAIGSRVRCPRDVRSVAARRHRYLHAPGRRLRPPPARPLRPSHRTCRRRRRVVASRRDATTRRTLRLVGGRALRRGLPAGGPGVERPLLHRRCSTPSTAPRPAASWLASPRRDPRPFRRSPHPARCGASLVWLVGQANGEFGRGSRRTAAWLWAWFGVGNCADRGRSLRRAAGLEPEQGSWSEPLPLGDPAVLHSRFRASLVAERDRMLEVAGRRRTWSVVGDDAAALGSRSGPHPQRSFTR